MNQYTYIATVGRLKQEEGFRQFPYTDSLGILTIGYGRNLVSRGISEEEASYILAKDVKMCEQQLLSALPWAKTLEEARLSVLVDMCFNIGLKSLMKFQQTLKAVKEARWEDAAKGMLNSLWAKQVGQRAVNLAEIMRTGQL